MIKTNPQHPIIIVASRWRAVYKYYYFIIRGDKGTQSFAQRAEPLAIIHQFAKGDGQLTLLVGGELVQRQSFQHLVGFVQDGAAGGLINELPL